MSEQKRGRLLWAAALAVLAAALIVFNLPAPEKSPAASTAAAAVTAPPAANGQASPEAAEPENALPPGFHAGERLADFSLTQTDGEEFTLSRYRGKAVVLNLWATWCTPCVNELPHFDRLQQAYPDTVKVLAIHSDLVTDDPLAYLAGLDYHFSFALDPTGETIAALGGSTMLPQTLVIAPDGTVTYNRVGSITYEALKELVQEALAR